MITTDEIKELERKAEVNGTSKLTLMENAGSEIARILQEKMDLKNKRILIVCYHGNNGGDGFVAARHLFEKAEVDILFIGEESRLKPEAKINFDKVEAEPMIQFTSLDFVDFDDYDVIIDAILGIGISGKLTPHIESTIDGINAARGFKLSVDVPSGLDPNTGNIEDRVVNADLIITFHDLKPGLESLKEKTVVADIGMPKD